MWYRDGKNGEVPRTSGYEETIARSDAERAVRRRLYLQGDYTPEQEDVNLLVRKVLSQLEEDFGNFDAIRRKVGLNTLAPAVEAAADAVLSPKQTRRTEAPAPPRPDADPNPEPEGRLSTPGG